MPLGYIGT